MTNLTLEEIARRVGVSRSTVSRVVNHDPTVGTEIRERVLKVVNETGYQPNPAARSLASRRSRVIGLVIPRSIRTFSTDPYFPRLTQGITQACNQHDYTLSLFVFQTSDDEEKLFPRISQSGFLDGVIIQSTHAGDRLIEQLKKSKTPFVVAGRPFIDNVSYVDVDNVAGAHRAVSYLIALGRRRIGEVAGPLITNAGRDREEGYHKALVDHGIPIDDEMVVEADFTEHGGYEAALLLLEQNPDAIFVGSDMMALGVLKAIHQAGLSVPKDIAVVGYDDLTPATMAYPQLTTIHQPIYEMGVHLVEMLLELIEGEAGTPRRVILETKLVVRESCGGQKPA